jgi:hypothetical protein
MSLNEYVNSTKNQHFVSQAEQRFNSCSPDAAPQKTEIYRFEVIDKKEARVRSDGKKAIGRNLSFQELFTILRVSDSERLNFEHLFQRYEGEYPAQVVELLQLLDKAIEKSSGAEKIDLEKVEGCNFSRFVSLVKRIYTYKVLNWLRNPLRIKEVLAGHAWILNHCIDNERALSIYFSLVGKNSAEKLHVCRTYGVSAGEYDSWIRLLLLFLFYEPGETNNLDGFVEEFFLADELVTSIMVIKSDTECALLPDTGVVRGGYAGGIATYINVAKGCVIILAHQPVDGAYLDETIKMLKLEAVPRSKLMEVMARKVFSCLFVNNSELLGAYNGLCVKSASRYVFSASPNVCGVAVV